MIKKLSTIVLTSFCTLMLATTIASAEEEAQKERIPVGTRSESVEERIAQLETRAKMVALQSKENQEDFTINGGVKSAAMKSMASVAAKSLYYTSHPSAYQELHYISYFGDMIELIDGSQWQISPLDTPKAFSWYSSDIIVITPNHRWLSPYSYCLTNQMTGESVVANLSLGPISPVYQSPFTHWIVDINYYHNIVILEDGSFWYMSSLDSNIVKQWVVGDVVIIGVNDGWLSGSNPNILLNVAMLNYAAGAAIF